MNRKIKSSSCRVFLFAKIEQFNKSLKASLIKSLPAHCSASTSFLVMCISTIPFRTSFAQEFCIASIIDFIESSCGTNNTVLLWKRRMSNNARDRGWWTDCLGDLLANTIFVFFFSGLCFSVLTILVHLDLKVLQKKFSPITRKTFSKPIYEWYEDVEGSKPKNAISDVITVLR